MTEEKTANAEQIAYWNELSGPKWVALADVIDAQIEPIGNAAIERAAVSTGERVLDVGCGCGQTTLELARRVGPAGRVVGIDISKPMLAAAEQRAVQAPASMVRFVVADAQTHRFEDETYDLAFSRFGVMFFDSPETAFANVRRALRPGGRLVFACWQELGRNPWMAVPGAAVARHVPLPVSANPHAPGPFAFADAERVKGLVRAGGFVDVSAESLERKLDVGRGLGLEEVVDFLIQLGPAGAALRNAGAPPDLMSTVRATLRDVLAPYDTGNGLSMDAAAWIFTARRPE